MKYKAIGGQITRETKIMLLNSLKRGRFEHLDVESLVVSLGGLVTINQTTADEEILKHSRGQKPQDNSTQTPQRPFTPQFRNTLLKALKNNYFDQDIQREVSEFLGVGHNITVVIVETREQIEQLERLSIEPL